jgi:hypothetical protein
MRRLHVGTNDPRSSNAVTARDVNQASAAVLTSWRREHDPQSVKRFSEKIMLNQRAKARWTIHPNRIAI